MTKEEIEKIIEFKVHYDDFGVNGIVDAAIMISEQLTADIAKKDAEIDMLKSAIEQAKSYSLNRDAKYTELKQLADENAIKFAEWINGKMNKHNPDLIINIDDDWVYFKSAHGTKLNHKELYEFYKTHTKSA